MICSVFVIEFGNGVKYLLNSRFVICSYLYYSYLCDNYQLMGLTGFDSVLRWWVSMQSDDAYTL